MLRKSRFGLPRFVSPLVASVALGALLAACATAESEAPEPLNPSAGSAGAAGSGKAGAGGTSGKAGGAGESGAAGLGGSEAGGAGAGGDAGSAAAGKGGSAGKGGAGNGGAGGGDAGGTSGNAGVGGSSGAGGGGAGGKAGTSGAGGAAGAGNGGGGAGGTGGGAGGAGVSGSGGVAGAGPAGLGTFSLNEIYVDMCLDGDATEWVEIKGPPGESTSNLVLRIFSYEGDALSLKYTVDFGDHALDANGLTSIGGGLSPSKISVSLAKWGLPEKGYLQLVDKTTKELYDTLGYGDVPAIEADESFGAPAQLVYGSAAVRTSFDQATCGARTIARKADSARTNNHDDYCIQTESANQPNDGVCQGGDGGTGGTGGAAGGGGAGGSGGQPLGTFSLNEIYLDMCLDGDNTEWVEIAGPPAASTSNLWLRIFSYEGDALSLKYTVEFGDHTIGDNGLTSIGGGLSPSKISVSLSKWGLPDKGYLQLVDKATKELYDTIGYGDVPVIEADASVGAPLQLVYGAPAARTAFDEPTCGARTVARKAGSGRTNNHDDYCVQLQSANQPNDGVCQ
jgi:hypothetical protein